MTSVHDNRKVTKAMNVFTKTRHLSKSIHFLSRWVDSKSWAYRSSVKNAFSCRKLRVWLVCEMEKVTELSSPRCHIYDEMGWLGTAASGPGRPGELVSCSTVTFTAVLRSRSETGCEIIFPRKTHHKELGLDRWFPGCLSFSVKESTEAMQKALVLCTSMNHTSEVLLFNGFWLESKSQTHFSHFILKGLF